MKGKEEFNYPQKSGREREGDPSEKKEGTMAGLWNAYATNKPVK